MENHESLLARIVELETTVAFQEATIGELNGVILEERASLDRLVHRVDRLERRLASSTTESDQGD